MTKPKNPRRIIEFDCDRAEFHEYPIGPQYGMERLTVLNMSGTMDLSRQFWNPAEAPGNMTNLDFYYRYLMHEKRKKKK